MVLVSVSQAQILSLDLSPVTNLVAPWLAAGTIAPQEHSIQFQIDFPRPADDPRELSEIPEVRLWFLRLDATYPWFPFLLDWKAGELARYVAMLVPHQFHRTEGIQYNPEALELLMMQKVFVLAHWLPTQNLPSAFRLKSLAQMLGYDLEDNFLAGLA
ncbi:CRR6 family NdhI maturation factor [Synechocystis sp. LKSZ1]|uniref:CRR6 family NdhI maturation factor n=1 Tax=Synechocystis sp. LKSZ1 TaxID=3144951 RepID=UPI00336C00D1